MLSLAGDVAARFEAGADSSVGGGRAQHPLDCRRSASPAADYQPLADAMPIMALKDCKTSQIKATDKRILKLLDKPPPEGFARSTGPLLAEALGDVDVQYVWRLLPSHKIDLAARKSWCESNDPNFMSKAADVVGLYAASPAKAIVLCVDEKPSIQAALGERRFI